jgi:hypothetical protein
VYTCPVDRDSVHTDRARDVFHELLAYIIEPQRQSVANLFVDDSRDEDLTGLGETFQSRRDVDTVSINIAILDDNIGEIYADTKLDPLSAWNLSIELGHLALYLKSTMHGVDNAGEFDKHAIAGSLDNSSSVFGDPGINYRALMSLYPRKCAILVGAHQSRVARDIGGQDRGEAAGEHFADRLKKQQLGCQSGLGYQRRRRLRQLSRYPRHAR